MKKDKENKTSNLAIYERNLKRNYALKGGIVGVELSAIPLSIAVANNVFGMHVIINDPSFVGDVINTTYRFVETWPVAISLGTAITTMSIFRGLNHAKEKINQRKNN